MRPPDELRGRVEAGLAELPFAAELGRARRGAPLLAPRRREADPARCSASRRARRSAASRPRRLPAACALELVHTFSLVHDDLPALDDDALRRGQPSAHVRFGEDVAILAGDALLAEAFRLALAYPAPEVGRVLADATLGMIGGQYLDVTTDGGLDARRPRSAPLVEDGTPPAGVDRVRRGRRGRSPRAEREPWAEFGARARAPLPDRRRHPRRDRHGRGARQDPGEGRRRPARSRTSRCTGSSGRASSRTRRAARSTASLDALPVDTSVLAELVEAIRDRRGGLPYGRRSRRSADVAAGGAPSRIMFTIQIDRVAPRRPTRRSPARRSPGRSTP